jgi:hypothetical protein
MAGLLAPLIYYNFQPLMNQWDAVQDQANARAAKAARKAQHLLPEGPEGEAFTNEIELNSHA